MSGFSMGFGMPPKPPPTQQVTDGSVPSVLVLMALVKRGIVAQWTTLAVSTSRAKLEGFMGEWMLRNQAIYGGEFHIGQVPFLVPDGVTI